MRRWWPLVAICLGTFMLLLDVTIVNVALPAMAGSLGSSFVGLAWVIDGYALALAALLMVAGSLADRFGRRRLYLTGLAVFAAASLACGLAPSAGALVAARVVQGIGGAAMFATALLATTYHGRDRGRAFGVWGAVNGFAAACGPLVGGVLTETWGWRAIFLVNLPVAAAAVALTLAVVAPDAVTTVAARLDLAGAAVLTVASTALVYGLIEAGSSGWSAPVTVVPLVVAALAVVGFAVVETRAEHPMLEPALLRRRPFVALMLAAAVLSGAAFAHLALVSLWLQEVLHLSPIRAGLAIVPLSVASLVLSAGVGRRLHGGSPAGPVAGGLALVGAGVLLLGVVDVGAGPWALLPGLVVSGLGVGLATPVLVSATLAVLPPAKAGVGGAAVNTFRQLGLAVGLAVLGTVFAGYTDPTAPASPQAFAAGLDAVFRTAGVAALLTAVLVVVLVRRAASEASEASGAVEGLRDDRRAPSVG